MRRKIWNYVNFDKAVERTAHPDFKRILMSQVSWPTLSFAHPGPPRYSGPGKKSRAYRTINQTFDLTGYDENQIESALSEVRAQVEASGFERGSYRGQPGKVYHDGLGLNLNFSYRDKGGFDDQRRRIFFSVFESRNAEPAPRERVFGWLRRTWLVENLSLIHI